MCPSGIGTVFDTLLVRQTRNIKNFNLHLYIQKLLFAAIYLHIIGSDFLVRILSREDFKLYRRLFFCS